MVRLDTAGVAWGGAWKVSEKGFGVRGCKFLCLTGAKTDEIGMVLEDELPVKCRICPDLDAKPSL